MSNHLFPVVIIFSLLIMDGWHGGFPATPAAEGVPHGGMGGARTDGEHPVTGPILKKSISATGKKMLPFDDSDP